MKFLNVKFDAPSWTIRFSFSLIQEREGWTGSEEGGRKERRKSKIDAREKRESRNKVRKERYKRKRIKKGGKENMKKKGKGKREDKQKKKI